jgi:hypothetical protein
MNRTFKEETRIKKIKVLKKKNKKGRTRRKESLIRPTPADIIEGILGAE